MKYLLQPIGTKLCGQYCLAVLLGISADEAIVLIGHEHGTKTKELTRHLQYGRMKRGIAFDKALCICRPVYKRIGNWHWTIHLSGRIYDPVLGYTIQAEKYTTLTGMIITSSIEIL